MDPSRGFVRHVKRVIVKVGTAVVTRSDGRLAVGILGALCEQLKELNANGHEVILMTSGAVGAGRQRLSSRKMVNSSFADLQKPQSELNGKACAAVATSREKEAQPLDLTSAQLLVTDNDFRDPHIRSQLTETVNQLLDLKVVPILNENDAVSTSRAPYEDSSGNFWDNDSLAALLALELKADLLILLSDVEGLYSGPPSDPRSKLISTYVKEKHQGEITFGDKSRLGRGGLTAKVKAAVSAAYAGIPVIIASGKATDNIVKVLNGQQIGTLFHKDAHLWASAKETGAREKAVAARECSRRLQALTSQERKKILLDIADALEANEALIKSENDADVAAAELAGYDQSLLARLALKPGKISGLAKSVRVLADMEEPIGQILKRSEIASLAVQNGNGLLLKCGKEAKRSNAILHKVITSALPENVGDKLIGLVTTRDEIPDLLQLDDVIDLVIPRGSNELVSQIKESTKIPVLGHAAGVVMFDELRASVLNGLEIPATQTFHKEYNSPACAVEIVNDVSAAVKNTPINQQCRGGFRGAWMGKFPPKPQETNIFLKQLIASRFTGIVEWNVVYNLGVMGLILWNKYYLLSKFCS
ncbi:hypothetical protein RND81_10G134400 [Saponaria officinalis]|uniref:Aspartate/glutamate/uridylate kinase domain-containing protein n=1 Tax=Saponaria officinalis TaxID=3572 RepID=A0AAW1I498_SAPOF